jgi:ABC-type transport system involved in multi-copper enzyme maturation permease subunit
MKGIARECVVELFDRKVVFLFAAVTLMAIMVIYLFGVSEIHIETHGDGAAAQVPGFLRDPQVYILATFLSLLVFQAVMATAGLVPNMLVRGRADYYLSKPISRAALLVHKLFGIWLVYGALIAVCAIVATLAVWLIHGVFVGGVFYLLVLRLILLFIWLSVTVLAGVLSGSATVSIMAAFIVYILQWILQNHELITGFFHQPAVTFLVDFLYYLLPKANQVGDMATALAVGRPVEDWLPLWSSLALSFILIYLAVAVFRRRDY